MKSSKGDKKQAFVCFQTGEEAKKATDEFNGKVVDGSDEPMYVTELLNKHERNEQNIKEFKKLKEKNLYKSLANNLYVNAIPKTCSEEDIRKEFEKFGAVESIKMHMMPSRDDKSKIEFIGAAFVCYKSAEDAKTAVYRGNIEPMFGRTIYVDYYKPKEVKYKEKKEEVGVSMKQMIHSFMMTALHQTRGGGAQRGEHRGGHRGGNSGGIRGGIVTIVDIYYLIITM
jgi:U1 small nuclear ribonucleoprotein